MKIHLLILTILLPIQLYSQVSDFSQTDLKKADSIALSLSKHEIKNIPLLTFKLTSDLETDAERFRAIYRWVCANIKNDYGLYLKNKAKRNRLKDDSLAFNKWHKKFRKRLFKKILKKQKTICTGYAYLVKTMSDFANIECKVINGYGRVSTTDVDNLNLPNHSWNAVKLNDKWYLCDPTWASGIPDPISNQFTFHYNDGFFLANPILFAVNHYPVDKQWWLLVNESIPTFEQFLAAPVIYGNTYKTLESHHAPQQMHHNIRKTDKIALNYTLKENLGDFKVRLLIDDGYNQKKVKPTSTELNGKMLNIEHQFNKTGFYDVHFYIEDDLIATYTVEVHKS